MSRGLAYKGRVRAWRRAVTVSLSVVVIAAGATAAYMGSQWHASSCTRAIDGRRFSEAVEACTRAFEPGRDGRFAASVAMAQLGLGRRDEAWTWANLAEARDQVRARRVRGVVSKMRGDLEQARDELQEALKLALERGEAAEAARTSHALAGIQWEQGQYSETWETLELSEREARRAGDGPALALAELARGDVLRRLGDGQRADDFYRRAVEATAAWAGDQAYALLKIGFLHRDRGALRLAQTHLEQALALAESRGNEGLVTAVRINLAEVLAIAGDFAASERHLSVLDEGARSSWDVPLTHARIALGRGDAEGALRLLDQVEKTELPIDVRWEVSTVRGHASLQAGRPDAAAAAWTAAIETVETLTAAEPEHQGWVVAQRRKPFDALFAFHVSRGEHAQAWSVIARYSLAEALSFTGEETGDPRRMIAAAQALKAEWPLHRGTVEEEGTSAALEGRDLLVLHEAEGRLWVGSRRAGEVRFVDAGPLSAFEDLLHRYLGNPDDRDAAEALGEALWRAAEPDRSTAPIYVRATGRLRRLAVAALRHDGRYWFEHRPIAQLPSLTVPRTPAVRFGGPAVIAGDPKGDLAAAREEVSWLAARLNVQARMGVEANREAILSAQGSALLHVATHAAIGLEGTRLVLADGELSAQEILRHRPHARVVVLASCASAVGRDAAGSDSLATAFLRAGSGAVLATLRTVPDAAAQQFVRAFYEHGGAADPISALARAQAEVAPSQPASIWSAFVIAVNPSSITSLAGR